MNGRLERQSRLRRLVITVCPREAGTVALSRTAGGRAVRLDAEGIRAQLDALVAERGLGHLVSVREGCAGGCTGRGPNVSVTIYPAPRAGAATSQVAIGWRTYVYSLASLPCLAHVIDDNLFPPHPAFERGLRPRNPVSMGEDSEGASTAPSES